MNYIDINRPFGEETFWKDKVRDSIPCEERLRGLKDCDACMEQWEKDFADPENQNLSLPPCDRPDAGSISQYTLPDGTIKGYYVTRWAKMIEGVYTRITYYHDSSIENAEYFPSALRPYDSARFPKGQDL